MSSASLEFIMAGNEQYRQNAFQAAEAGIEQAITNGTFNPDVIPAAMGGTNGTDGYTAAITPQLAGAPQPALWGNSWNTFSTYHFEVQSTGTSARSTQAVNVQGIAVISPYDPAVQKDPALPTATLQ
jgi:hypothetical protein